MSALEMLWEADDPADALRTRFGFPDATAAANWISATQSRASADP